MGQVPITPKVEQIITLYPDLDFPFISNQKMNQFLKELGKLAEITQSVIITRYRGNSV